MDVPLQIAFHKHESVDWAEDEIRSHVDRLNRMEPHIIGCRVTVDQRADNTHHSIPPVVRIELDMPGSGPIMVTYEPDRLQKKYQNPDLRTAIEDAFDLAERQLEAWKGRRSGANREEHDLQNQFRGQVAELAPEDDHGFLMTKEGGLLYFHRNSILGGDFDQLRIGDDVHYVESIGDTGPLATKVRPV